MRKGLWGVPEEYGERLKDVGPGDKLVFYGRDFGFAFCEVKGRPFYAAALTTPGSRDRRRDARPKEMGTEALPSR